MAILHIIYICLGLASLISSEQTKVGAINCSKDSKATLSKNSSDSKIGTLPSTTKSSCLLELTTSCQNCYLDIVFRKMELAITGPRKWVHPGTTIPVTQDDAIIVQEENKTNLTVFQGNLTGQFIITATKGITVSYSAGYVRTYDVKWNISYTLREIKHKSCYWGINLRHTCPDGKCSDKPLQCGRLIGFLDIPPAGVSKEVKTNIFMGIIGGLALLVVIFLLVLICRRPRNRKKIYLCLTCKECLCICKRKRKKSITLTPLPLTATHIIIDDVEPAEPPQYDAVDKNAYPPKENQAAEERLPSYDEASNKNGYTALLQKDDDDAATA